MGIYYYRGKILIAYNEPLYSEGLKATDVIPPCVQPARLAGSKDAHHL